MTKAHAQLVVAAGLSEADIPGSYKQPAADVFHVITEHLGIDDARYLVTIASTKPVGKEDKVVVVVFKRATVEAQNALLKLFEEPPADVLFFVVVPHESVLLPTLRSRLISLTDTSSKAAAVSADTEAFLKASIAERLSMVAEKQKAKEGEWMAGVVHELSVLCAVDPSGFSKHTMDGIVTAERYINIRGASRKSLLEDLALRLP